MEDKLILGVFSSAEVGQIGVPPTSAADFGFIQLFG